MAKVGFYNDNQYRDYPFIGGGHESEFYELAQDAIVDVGFTLGPSVIYDPAKDSIALASVESDGTTLKYNFYVYRNSVVNPPIEKPTDPTIATGIAVTFSLNADTSPFSTVYADGAYVLGDRVLDDLTFDYNPDLAVCTFNAEYATVRVISNMSVRGFLTIGDSTKILDDVYRRGGIVNFATYVVEPSRVQSSYQHYLNSIRIGNKERLVIPECADTPVINDPAPEDEEEETTYIFPRNDLFNAEIRFVAGQNVRLVQNEITNTITFSPLLGFGATTGSGDTDACDYRGELPFTEVEAFAFTDNLDNANLPPAWKKALDTFVDDTLSGSADVNKAVENMLKDFRNQYAPVIYTDDAGLPVKSKYLSGGKTCAEGIFSINGVGGTNVTIIAGANVEITNGAEDNELVIKRLASATGGCG